MAGEGASLRGWNPARDEEDEVWGRGRGTRPSKLADTEAGATGAAGGTGAVATLRFGLQGNGRARRGGEKVQGLVSKRRACGAQHLQPSHRQV